MATRTAWPDASTLRRQTRALDQIVATIVDYLRENPPVPGPPGPEGPPGPTTVSTLRVTSSGPIALPTAALVTVLLAAAAPVTVSLGGGNGDGQRVVLLSTSDAAVTVQLAATDAIGTPLTEIQLAHVAAGAQFVWDDVAGRWLPIGVSFG
jgi:hypothetical protein